LEKARDTLWSTTQYAEILLALKVARQLPNRARAPARDRSASGGFDYDHEQEHEHDKQGAAPPVDHPDIRGIIRPPFLGGRA